MNSDLSKYMKSILDSIKSIELHLAQIKSFNEYRFNPTVKDAVEWRLILIGDSLNKTSLLNNNISITNRNKLISLSDTLIHNYDVIDDASIWKIIQTNLKILKKEIQKYLD